MSLREVSSSTPFLAKKGGAAPAIPGVARGGPAGPSLRPIDSDGEISLESAPAEAPASVVGPTSAVGTGGKRSAEAAPAASLLPFDLLRKKYRPDAVPDLVEDEPDIAPLDFVAVPEPEQQAELALRVKSEPYPTAEPMPPLELKAPASLEPHASLKPEVTPRLDAPAPIPSPDPEWRVGFETPDQTPHAEAEYVSPKIDPAKKDSSGGWLFPLGALAAAFTALVVGWNMTNPDFDLDTWLTPKPVASSGSAGDSVGDAATPVAPVAIEPPPPVAESPEVAASPTPVEPEGDLVPPESTTAEPETAPPPPLQASLPEPVLDPPKTSAPETPGASTPTKPTVDVVRLEANGDAVIAGRAAPNTELIVLDNGEPIGTVQADAFGEWVFVPEAALPIGDHEFALVVKTVEESVSLPAPSVSSPSVPALPPAPDLEIAPAVPESEPTVQSEAARTAETPDATVPDAEINEAPAVGEDETVVPVPAPKPEPTGVSAAPTDGQTATQAETPTPVHEGASAENLAVTNSVAANTADFVVQLASVKTQAGAEQEWRRLKQKFPTILSDMVPTLDEVKLVDYGTVIRVRTGAFDSQRDATTLCAQLAEKRQACLVVKTGGGN